MAQAALSELLRTSRPSVATGKALLAVDLQNDFLSDHGKLPVTLLAGFHDKLAALVSSFRQSGHVLWIRTEYDATQNVGLDEVVLARPPSPNATTMEAEEEDSEDEFIGNAIFKATSAHAARPSSQRTADLVRRVARRTHLSEDHATQSALTNDLFLANGSDPTRQCCLPASDGAQLAPLAEALRHGSNDPVITKRSYSAFNSTSLLAALRLKMITHLYICGLSTNVSVYATAADAVSHGFEVTVIEDCLGYVSKDAHELALKQMVNVIGANCISALRLREELGGAASSSAESHLTFYESDDTEKLPISQMKALSLNQGSSDWPEARRISSDPSLVSSGSLNSPEPISKVNISPSSSGLMSLPEYAHPHAARPTTPHPVVASPAPEAASERSSSGVLNPTPLLKRPGEHIGEGDSSIVYNFLPDVDGHLFLDVKSETHWQKMFHAQGEVPRLVCVQGTFGRDGCMPIYRHPSDQSHPLLHFSPNVKRIKEEVEKVVGHAMNHVLIQLYRHGEDYISEHSDKTLDIVHGSSIVNVSLGAQRTMRLRTKKPPKDQANAQSATRQTQLIPMPHCSMFILGLETNRAWLHGINPDKRPEAERSSAEKAFGGERISLTFRKIGTYLDSKSERMWGQGASAKDKLQSRPVINGKVSKTQEMINAFGCENQRTKFDWEDVYGRGFDVLNFGEPLKETRFFFPSGNRALDLPVKMFLEELGIDYHEGGVPRHDTGLNFSPDICFRDIDLLKTEIRGHVPILLYLDRIYTENSPTPSMAAETYSKIWDLRDFIGLGNPRTSLTQLEEFLMEEQYLAGDCFSIVDCAFWPIVDEIIRLWEPWEPLHFPRVARYHQLIMLRASVRRALDAR